MIGKSSIDSREASKEPARISPVGGASVAQEQTIPKKQENKVLKVPFFSLVAPVFQAECWLLQ